MSSISELIGGGGGGLTPKFQEFTSSGTFTPSAALIAAGGYIEVFLVGGGSSVEAILYGSGGAGGEVLSKQMYLTSTTGISVTIGAGAASAGTFGTSSTFNGASAGGINVTARYGGGNDSQTLSGQYESLGAGWGHFGTQDITAGTGVFGYGAGGAQSWWGGIFKAKANSGQGGSNNYPAAGSGYCLVKWYE